MITSYPELVGFKKCTLSLTVIFLNGRRAERKSTNEMSRPSAMTGMMTFVCEYLSIRSISLLQNASEFAGGVFRLLAMVWGPCGRAIAWLLPAGGPMDGASVWRGDDGRELMA